MRKILAGLLITGVLMVASVDAYQICSDAMQVTFKNGVNIVVDMENGLNIF